MIDELMEEQAALHVLGALTETEAREFKRALQADPELQAHVARLSVATGALAGSVTRTEPPPQLRAKILAQVAPTQKTVELPEPKRFLLSRFGWGFAACLLVIAVMLSSQNGQLRDKVQTQTKQLDDLNKMARSLQTMTNHLQQTVMALRETNRLANLKIALLNSLVASAPTTVAVSLWDESKQAGVFVVQNLKQLPANRDYQLWVLDNGTTPVDAGVFHVNADGSGRVEFKAKLPIKVAGRFAVTEETKGGVASPTIKNMVLASK